MSASPMLLDKPASSVSSGVGSDGQLSPAEPKPNSRECVSVQAFVPPSTVRFAPVMYEASGLAMNATSDATSSTFPTGQEQCWQFEV